MKIRVYQIAEERDEKHLMFRCLETVLRENGKLPAEIYECVYEGELNAKTLEDVFYILNCCMPVDYSARSLSVSDVVEIVKSEEHSSFYYCDSFGFQHLPFDNTAIKRTN